MDKLIPMAKEYNLASGSPNKTKVIDYLPAFDL